MQNKIDITPDVIDAIFDKKGKKIVVIDLSKFESAPTSKFIICQGSNTAQVSAIADSIREKLHKKQNIKPYNYTGYQNSQWIVLDYGDTFIHVFLPDIREFYNIEDLWNDAPTQCIPDLD